MVCRKTYRLVGMDTLEKDVGAQKDGLVDVRHQRPAPVYLPDVLVAQPLAERVVVMGDE